MKGKIHPNTLSTMFGLACSWYELGRDEDSESLMKEVARLRESVLGELHPHTDDSINILARWQEGRMRREIRGAKEDNCSLNATYSMPGAWISDDESSVSELTPLGVSDDGAVET